MTLKIVAFLASLTNGRGSRVVGCGSRLAVAAPKHGRSSNVAVSGPKSRSRVQCRGQGSNVGEGGNDLGFELTE